MWDVRDLFIYILEADEDKIKVQGGTLYGFDGIQQNTVQRTAIYLVSLNSPCSPFFRINNALASFLCLLFEFRIKS
ncbi:hypothetical protein RB195_008971 [Necator americanus]|uniref:Uncharacterized protein n=1 Tax=Necator americanus TaxID=51031 RepID=A0ABR1CSW4_NECAM